PLDLGRVAGREWRHVARAVDDHGIDEMLVKVIDELGHAILERAADRDVVEHRQMLHELAESDTARVRADRHAELGRHENDGEILVDAAEAATVDLAEADGAGLEQLLEQHTVGAVFNCRYSYGRGPAV